MTDPTQDRVAALVESSTSDELKARAKDLNVRGRTKMSAEELAGAILEAQDAADVNAPDYIAPATDAERGRPPAGDVAEQRAAERAARTRVVGDDDLNPDNQEG